MADEPVEGIRYRPSDTSCPGANRRPYPRFRTRFPSSKPPSRTALNRDDERRGTAPAERSADAHAAATLNRSKTSAGIGRRSRQVMAIGRSPRCET